MDHHKKNLYKQIPTDFIDKLKKLADATSAAFDTLQEEFKKEWDGSSDFALNSAYAKIYNKYSTTFDYKKQKKKRFRDTIDPEEERRKTEALKIELKIIQETKIVKQEKEIQREMVIHKGQPSWLIVKKDGTYDFLDSNLWECSVCKKRVISDKTDEKKYCPSCEKLNIFNQLSEGINKDLWYLPIWKDIPIEQVDMKALYNELYHLNGDLIVFPSEILQKCFTLAQIASYKILYWNEVGFHMFLGLHDSGKTRAQDMMAIVGYRATKPGTLTSKAVIRIVNKYTALIQLDEIQNTLDTRTESGKELNGFCNQSYRKGSVYVCASKDNPTEIEAYSNFGIKTFAGEKNYSGSLSSRSIIYNMEQAVPKVAKIEYKINELAEIETRLLNWSIKTKELEDMGNDFELKGRTREVFEYLIITARECGIPYGDIIKFAKETESENRDQLKDKLEFEILQTIREETARVTQGKTSDIVADFSISYKTIARMVYDDYRPDQLKSLAQRIGYKIREMKIRREIERDGAVIYVNSDYNNKRFHYLYRRYGVPVPEIKPKEEDEDDDGIDYEIDDV